MKRWYISVGVVLFSVFSFIGCQSLQKATFITCFDCHHNRALCPKLFLPRRSDVDVEIVFDKDDSSAKIDAIRQELLSLSEVKSIEFVPANLAGEGIKGKDENVSLEIKMFKIAGGESIRKVLARNKGSKAFFRVPSREELEGCRICHNKAMKFDIHPRHSETACKVCHNNS